MLLKFDCNSYHSFIIRLLQILHVSLFHSWVTVMNRSKSDCVEAWTSSVQLAACITPRALLYAQQNAHLHARVSCWGVFCISWVRWKTATISFLTFARHLITQGPSYHACDDGWVEIQTRRTIRAENEVEANKLVNNYRVRSLKANDYIH